MENPIFTRRKMYDLKSLLKSDYKINLDEVDNNIIYVQINGPPDSIYNDGVWDIRIELPKEYPYKSPSIGFVNKIYHPNVDFASGTICLDVINETWTPMYNLINIIDIFLPQLLTYPNPEDPLNSDASKEMLNDNLQFEKNVINNIKIYAMSSESKILYK